MVCEMFHKFVHHIPTVICLLITCVLTPVLFAQSTTASLLGIVKDSSGAVLPNVDVTAINAETSFTRTVMTDGEGGYLFTNLPVGSYELRITAPGFQTFVQTGITLVV